jgi:NAD-dependent SIR2 family protein deacetylase
MKSKVLFLGAGTSKAFGLPLTGEIFPLIIERLKTKVLFKGNVAEQNELLTFIEKLYPGLNKIPSNEYPLITDTLSLLDHLLNTGNCFWESSKTKDIVLNKTLFEKAIFEILEIPFRRHFNSQFDETPIILKQFSNWIYENHKEVFFSIISTNYDITVEREIYSKFRFSGLSEIIDFGINWRDPSEEKIHLRPTAASMGIYKLHGSTNWLKCNLCNHIYINTHGSIYHQAFRDNIDSSNTCECGYGPLSSLIVAPSLARVIYDNNLPHIWNNAFERLRTAAEWIIIGYSFPPEDLNIKSMLVRAFNARKEKPQVTIVQKGNDFKSRYESIFNDITYLDGGLEEFVDLKTKNT